MATTNEMIALNGQRLEASTATLTKMLGVLSNLQADNDAKTQAALVPLQAQVDALVAIVAQFQAMMPADAPAGAPDSITVAAPAQ